MKRHGKPEIRLEVWGDWSTIIGAREYRDELIDQKPYDEQDAEYSRYVVKCEGLTKLLEALAEFRVRLKMRCAIAMSFASEDSAVKAYMTTDTGYGKQEPFADVTTDDSDISAKSSIKQAIEILEGAIQ